MKLDIDKVVSLNELISKQKKNCNRTTLGSCHSEDCLARGGYKDGDVVDYHLATCDSYKQIQALEQALSLIEYPEGIVWVPIVAEEYHRAYKKNIHVGSVWLSDGKDWVTSIKTKDRAYPAFSTREEAKKFFENNI